jgi:hypothetical protein
VLETMHRGVGGSSLHTWIARYDHEPRSAAGVQQRDPVAVS